ncbi:MAG: hypothetical protein WBZ30_07650 [Bradyrhizobium sp.]
MPPNKPGIPGKLRKHHEVRDLPHDKERGNIEPNDTTKLNRRKVEAKAIAKEKRRPGKEKPTARQPCGLTYSNSNDGIPEGFK